MQLGLETEIVPDALKGEAREAARTLAARAVARQESSRHDAKPLCLLAGGETTVTVRGKGCGGRNQEFALAFALEIAETDGVVCLSAGTDGTDGPTDAAGAVVDGGTVAQARAAGLDPQAFLANNDAYTFFAALDRATGGAAHHYKPGPTGTNVMDLVAVAISPRGGERGNG